ncbi:MAG: hotdog fold thioesterase [Chitinophagaceae bacterium]
MTNDPITPMIWHNKQLTLEDIITLGKGSMADHIGIEWTEIGADFLKARMPVDHRTKQPYGLLHGGASAVLAETLGSVGSALVVDHTKFYCVGLEINANHIRSAKQGFVTGHVTPLHLGRQTHVWDIKIYNEEGKLTCVSRLTVAVLPR